MKLSPERWHLLLGGLVASMCLTATSCSLVGLAASAALVKLQYGCLAMGEEIDTPGGPVPVESIRTGDLVIGYDGKPVRVLRVDQYREDPARQGHLALVFPNGGEIHLSPRHRVAGTPAGEILVGDRVAGHRISRVRPLEGISRSFDLLTEDAGYQIHGVPVNSMILEMEQAGL